MKARNAGEGGKRKTARFLVWVWMEWTIIHAWLDDHYSKCVYADNRSRPPFLPFSFSHIYSSSIVTLFFAWILTKTTTKTIIVPPSLYFFIFHFCSGSFSLSLSFFHNFDFLKKQNRVQKMRILFIQCFLAKVAREKRRKKEGRIKRKICLKFVT